MRFWLLRFFSMFLPDSLITRFMPFDPAVLKESFAPIRPRIAEYSPLFYKNFWEDYPETRQYFGKNLTQAELDTRINHFMLFIVENCERPSAYLDYIHALAKRHKGYGIARRHFEYVSATNIKTLKQMLGTAWKDNYETQWRKSFGVVESLFNTSETYRP